MALGGNFEDELVHAGPSVCCDVGGLAAGAYSVKASVGAVSYHARALSIRYVIRRSLSTFNEPGELLLEVLE